jgi:peptidoglycan/LPS O-acetylase OafA/YrhL
MADSLSKEHHYLPAFDGLRTICITAVLVMHIENSFDLCRNTWIHSLFLRGWYGVDVFFVLSGFLITWILTVEWENSATIDLPRFYTRRALRLMPAYYSAITLTLIATRIEKPVSFYEMLWALPFFLTYTLNIAFAFGHAMTPLGLAWSLSLEEQFYFFWPWFLRRFGMRRALKFVIGAVAAIAIYRSALYLWLNGTSPTALNDRIGHRLFNGTDTRFDVILVGCGLALLMRQRRWQWLWDWAANWRPFSTVAVIVAFACTLWFTGGPEPSWASVRSATIGYTVMAISVAAVIMALFLQPTSWVSRLLASPPMVFVGRVSYGIYLFHILVVGAVARFFAIKDGRGLPLWEVVAVFATSWAGVIAVAVVHYYIVELPILNVRGRLRSLEKRATDVHPRPEPEAVIARAD